MAALAVICWHYQFFFFGIDRAAEHSRDALPFAETLSILFKSGLYAVQWFWVLSGYIFFFNYRDALENGSIGAREFFSRRFARLYPLHLATLLLVAFLFWLYRYLFSESYPYFTQTIPTWSLVSHIFFMSNWFTTQTTFNGPIWSVSIEILVYFLFFSCTKIFRHKGITKTGFMATACLLAYYIADKQKLGTALWFAQCAACFYLGGLVYEIRRNYRVDIFLKPTNALLWAIIVAAIAAAHHFRPTYANSFLIPVGTILFIVCTDVIEKSKWVSKVKRAGNWTYASYLLHLPVALFAVIWLRLAHQNVTSIAETPTFFLAYVCVVFALSELCFRFFENPARKAFARVLIQRRTILPDQSPLTDYESTPYQDRRP
jgi:peptidoglycan/LPS O-acetylase OafA/YrhL